MTALLVVQAVCIVGFGLLCAAIGWGLGAVHRGQAAAWDLAKAEAAVKAISEECSRVEAELDQVRRQHQADLASADRAVRLLGQSTLRAWRLLERAGLHRPGGVEAWLLQIDQVDQVVKGHRNRRDN